MKKFILVIITIFFVSEFAIMYVILNKEDEKITKVILLENKFNFSSLDKNSYIEENNCMEEIKNQAIREQELIEPFKYSDMENYIIQYKNILNTYSEYLDLPESLENCFTEKQINIMLSCIETEVYQCPFEAKVNVATVILNRVESDLYSNDPIDIITKKNQFAYGRENITEDTKLALEYAWYFNNYNLGTNCIGFRSDKLVENWNGWEYFYTDGYHYFYNYVEKGDN